ncbi:CHAP domain-containing protein [Staphylococcus petrasii]|uniref:CHAP domain-containing protein n=1 Tax=Staphylococcus petrasii TaxID=1276936 RepID=UPI000CD0EC16|nr:CHAP domain-containing protein [Staphylococcus petrasii]PNZ83697.1 CHAP domain-containing protein [Staphylococcus petrasii]TGA82533.1 CHAP domain-containing protein [Staphylococcus petrasii]SUM60283.1 secretory antigen SsaA [Staphylococcus petrasii]
MKKFLLIIVVGSALLTGGALYDGVDNQDMTEPTIHFWQSNPMKFNTYVKGQCTYYAFDRIRQNGNMINNEWGDAKEWASKAEDEGYKVDEHPKPGSILQTSEGDHGHVAYVEKVNDNGSLTVSDMNYKKPYEVTTRHIGTYEVKDYNYIHPKNNAKA